MEGDPPPPGEGPPLSHSIPAFMNSGDLIDQQTLLLRAAKDSEGNSVNLPNPLLLHLLLKEAIGSDPNKCIHATKEARGTQYILRTTSKRILQKLLSIKQFSNGQQVEVILHPHLNKTQGIIYDLDTINIPTEEILSAVRPQNVVEIRRITKVTKGMPINTPLLVLSFAGSHLPETIFLGLVRVRVRKYYPSPMQCFRCGRFAHGSKTCVYKEICLNCGTEHETSNENPCTKPSDCTNCNDSHSARDKSWPVYQKEYQVVKIKTDNGLSFPETRALVNQESRKQSYAATLKDRLSPGNDEKDRTIQILREEIAQLRGLTPKKTKQQLPNNTCNNKNASNTTKAYPHRPRPGKYRPSPTSPRRLSVWDHRYLSG
ncbi:uncharacterized protein LOC131694146 [Topomyia yanbarensis]|uniref:uncharacterized protein LOC131694146 n=1 Tax=Topomyia yanbarensis TaxID=2498891 RepID=UPI00273C3F79|nr:uncharacterized protein LOC131694146 [Topomyia yanbarensis]